MIKKEFTVVNKFGLHARPAAQLVKLANTFESEIWVEKDSEQVNGKSIMGLMMLAAGHGSTITVSVDGGDEEDALAAVEELINSGFKEE
ncbi:HPr family phosphocarrier protein [Sulfuriroseicoccus oceanibius]|uniref:HPr family phosphocarrier protein n=1 Tax=Sulfuriroseicoccus oceanibius TaxID=2707525 RepID=A0A6B3L5N4_9BACT|nr:HPr family phosphocarrier protein [Sulfuriroseicoccus oceanibius]QQL44180.1 HPr family phosphocarrier protein [Sulfuriroseicoccus oceanibius]